MSAELNNQAAAGIRATRREVRVVLERFANELAVISQFYGRDVVCAATDQNRLLAFEASMKGLYEAAADRPMAVPVATPAPVAAPTPVAVDRAAGF